VDYRLFISQQALELLSLKDNDRKQIRRHLEAIRDFPSTQAHYEWHDAAGRRIQGCIVGKFAIDYWEDFADRDVKIIAIQPADRAQMS
jgi:hypothetical protein